ncbi:MAG: nuclear transport factor 2 family protein [Pseudomonadota bacterium]
MASLAQGSDRIGSIIDRLSIAEHIAEYAQLWDRKDAVGVAELFANDATIDWVFGTRPQGTVVKGRAEILAYARKAHAERLEGKQSRHHFTNLVFKALDTAHAITEHTVFVTHQVPEAAPAIVATGLYRIEWTKADGRWLIAQRTLYLDR